MESKAYSTDAEARRVLMDEMSVECRECPCIPAVMDCIGIRLVSGSGKVLVSITCLNPKSWKIARMGFESEKSDSGPGLHPRARAEE